MIRPAGSGDVAALAEVAAAAYRAGFAAILDEAQFAARDEAYFRARFAGEWPSILVAAAEDGGCLGFAQVRGGVLDMLFVSPRRAGQGVGRQLLREAEAAGAVSLTCFRDNHRARSFYEREGWRLEGAHEAEFAGRPMAFVTYAGPLVPRASR